MEAKHTPGPWAFGADPCPDNATAIAICKENIDAHTKTSSGHFFVVFTPDGRRTAMVGHGPDGAANARLIASAPELLAALQWLDIFHPPRGRRRQRAIGADWRGFQARNRVSQARKGLRGRAA